jgi:diguanylate cyclase (GGDEF)-like protein
MKNSQQRTAHSSDPGIRVFIVGRGAQGCSFTVKGNIASIGRDFSNDVQLDDPSVSREHALISRQSDQYFIEDLGSKNGTRIDGLTISARRKVPVKEGSPIGLGVVLISLGKRSSENLQPDQPSHKILRKEEALFDYRVTKYKQALKSIQSLCSSFLETMNLQELCEEALHSIFSFLKGADRAYVLLADEGPGGEVREMASCSRLGTQHRGTKYGKRLVEQVIRDGRAMILPGTESKIQQVLSESMLNMELTSALCVPLRSRFGTRGVIYAQSETPKSRFSKEDLFFVHNFSVPLTLAIETALVYEKREEAEKVLKRAQDELESAVRERTAELEKTKDEMEKLSITDGLTGLSNYRYFMQALESEFRRAIRYSRNVSLLMIDIDYFKNLNDTYGHLCGDFVIKKVAEVIKRVVRSTDVVARYGGDELAVILPETNKANALQVAEKLKGEIIDCRFEWRGKSVEVRISIGIGTGPAPGIGEFVDLLNAADRALYRAKQGGRNLVVGSQPVKNE